MNIQQFRNLQNQSENDTELIARLLFELLPKIDQTNQTGQRAISEQSKEYGDERQANQRAEKQRSELLKVAEGITKVIQDKHIDLSEVIVGLKSLKESIDTKEHENGSQGIVEAINAKHPELESILKEIVKITRENKPSEVNFREVIKSQEKGFGDLAKILSGIATDIVLEEKEIKFPEFPKEIEVKKPKWYKPFELDLNPIKGFLSPITDLLEKILKRKVQELPIVKGRVLVEVDRTGGSGGGVIDTNGTPINPATKEGQDSIITLLEGSTTPTIYNIILTTANTEYSQSLPDNTKQLQFRCRGLYDVRYSFTTGKVASPTAPYLTLSAGMKLHEENLNLTSKTLYFACTQANQVIELLVFN